MIVVSPQRHTGFPDVYHSSSRGVGNSGHVPRIQRYSNDEVRSYASPQSILARARHFSLYRNPLSWSSAILVPARTEHTLWRS